ncbi:BQ2448_6290 [Microbotryum intermedium]|uniref:BQ2448_6290 protein n=1 Tax=Microbotryum intermedium TaxID=269621 RepID=A0A238FJ95_9BASI|nr:BQ2448_6290 [Microbotryum intermedium]
MQAEADLDESSAPVPRGYFRRFGINTPFTYVSATLHNPPLGLQDRHLSVGTDNDNEKGTDSHDEQHSDFNADLAKDQRFQDEEEDSINSRGSSNSSFADQDEVDGNENPRFPNNDMDSTVEDVTFNHNRYDDSDEDDEESRRLDLHSRGIATDADMVHLEFNPIQTLRKADDPKLHNLRRGLQIVLARSIQFSHTARLDPFVEQHMDQETMKHFFRPYAKAVVALPRLCRFYKDAQDAVEKVLEERVIKPELEETSKDLSSNGQGCADFRHGRCELNKIKDHIEEHRDPIFLMTTYLDNSLVFSDEHIMFWLYNAGEHDPKEKIFKAYENFLANVAGHIAKGYQVGGDAYDWRNYAHLLADTFGTYVEPLYEESLSQSLGSRAKTSWHQHRACLNSRDRDADSKLLSKSWKVMLIFAMSLG